jgi:hypothetical protein
MSIAPLHGRPAPLLFVRQTPREEWPHYRAADLKNAPLSTRARRLRKRRLSTIVLGAAVVLVLMAALAWTLLNWKA